MYLYEMLSEDALDALNDACLPCCRYPVACSTRCQKKKLTSSLATPRRSTTTPTSQLKSKLKTESSEVSSLPFADTAC